MQKNLRKWEPLRSVRAKKSFSCLQHAFLPLCRHKLRRVRVHNIDHRESLSSLTVHFVDFTIFHWTTARNPSHQQISFCRRAIFENRPSEGQLMIFFWRYGSTTTHSQLFLKRKFCRFSGCSCGGRMQIQRNPIVADLVFLLHCWEKWGSQISDLYRWKRT